MAKVQEVLDSTIVNLLKEETIVQLITINAETKKPELTVVSWVLATEDGKQVKIAVGHKGSSINNIQADPAVTLGIIGPESCYSVQGTASVSDVFQGTMKYRVITVDVEEVEDVMFYGGKLTSLPKYEKTYDAALAKKLDDEVYELLSK
ncbi:PNPOx family protein [Bacillus tuaregi]|uniref:pyridoxamine 5'-phosphate oxidase n=1 Tax=Bacillus tuaregi TaxID=1816695 RepID=UPI0008F8BA7E|nr:pyridoxamine 5'-phosphate oxidase [Bacillus tuaregi]